MFLDEAFDDRTPDLDPARGSVYGAILSIAFFWLPLFILL